MSDEAQKEPTMEDILASIRQVSISLGVEDVPAEEAPNTEEYFAHETPATPEASAEPRGVLEMQDLLGAQMAPMEEEQPQSFDDIGHEEEVTAATPEEFDIASIIGDIGRERDEAAAAPSPENYFVMDGSEEEFSPDTAGAVFPAEEQISLEVPQNTPQPAEPHFHAEEPINFDTVATQQFDEPAFEAPSFHEAELENSEFERTDYSSQTPVESPQYEAPIEAPIETPDDTPHTVEPTWSAPVAKEEENFFGDDDFDYDATASSTIDTPSVDEPVAEAPRQHFSEYAPIDDTIEPLHEETIAAPAEVPVDTYSAAPVAAPPSAPVSHETAPAPIAKDSAMSTSDKYSGTTLTEEKTSSAAAMSLGQLISRMEFGGENTVESLVRELLRPMLKEWLDDNLPRIVEDKVEAEVQRIARMAR